MSKVLNIRDVPDDVHRALVAAADAEGLSLTRFVQRELRHVARRAEVVRSNAEVIRRTQSQVRGAVGTHEIQSVLDEGRGT